MGFSGISLTQVCIILLVIVLVFGTKRLRSVGAELGKGLKSFRKAIRDDDEKKS